MKNFNNIIQDCKKIHNNYYSYSLIQNSDTLKKKDKVQIVCPVHGVFEQSLLYHHKGQKCPKCLGRGLTTDDYIKEFNYTHNNYYDYSLVKEINSFNDIIQIICPVHGVFEQQVNLHKYGHGCKDCGYEKNSKTQTHTKEQIIEKCSEVHKNYTYEFHSETPKSHDEFTVICPKHGRFNQLIYSHLAGKGCKRCSSGRSNYESSLRDFIVSLGDIIVKENDRSIIYPKEIDLFLPEYNFGIEFNGLMWHSIGDSNRKYFNTPDNKQNRLRHKEKTEKCENKGIQLFQIFENEYLDYNKQQIWKSLIKNKLQKTENKIQARKCKIKEISHKEAKDFVNENHLQGYINSKIKIGLFHNNVLVQVMTFGKGRNSISSCYDYELLRMCSLKNHIVIGGASKLLRYFEKTYNPVSLVSYANRRWSQGNVYKKLGFKFSHKTEPNFFYFKEDNLRLQSRQKYQKYKLKKLYEQKKIEFYDDNLSAWEIMKKNNFRKIYDSGNLVFVKEY